jgi:uncharacterized protein YdaU (DUF1376 family)
VFYYQHHIGDFIKATARLTDEQSMAYLRLIWRYYDQEGPLPDNVEALAFQLGTSEQIVRLLLVSYFKLEDGYWRHTRCDEEINGYRTKAEQASKAGRASAERRLNARSSSVEQPLNAPSTFCQPTNNHKPETNRKEREAPFPRPSDVSEQVWEDFLKARKEKKAVVTVTVMDRYRKQAEEAGISLEEAISYALERNWQGFNAKWYEEREGKKAEPEVPWYNARRKL